MAHRAHYVAREPAKFRQRLLVVAGGLQTLKLACEARLHTGQRGYVLLLDLSGECLAGLQQLRAQA